MSHSPFSKVKTLVAEENARLTAECGTHCTQEDFRRIDTQMHQLESAAQYLELQKNSRLTTEQAVALGENIAALLPIYGTPLALYQAITGESPSGKDLSSVERFFNGVASVLPAGAAAYKLIGEFAADMRIAMDGVVSSATGALASNGEGLFTSAFRAPYAPANQIFGQAFDFSCAAASCKMAANLIDTPEAYVRQAILTDSSRTMLADIPTGLHRLGFTGTATYASTMTIESMAKATSDGASVIVNVNRLLLEKVSQCDPDKKLFLDLTCKKKPIFI